MVFRNIIAVNIFVIYHLFIYTKCTDVCWDSQC